MERTSLRSNDGKERERERGEIEKKRGREGKQETEREKDRRRRKRRGGRVEEGEEKPLIPTASCPLDFI